MLETALKPRCVSTSNLLKPKLFKAGPCVQNIHSCSCAYQMEKMFLLKWLNQNGQHNLILNTPSVIRLTELQKFFMCKVITYDTARYKYITSSICNFLCSIGHSPLMNFKKKGRMFLDHCSAEHYEITIHVAFTRSAAQNVFLILHIFVSKGRFQSFLTWNIQHCHVLSVHP